AADLADGGDARPAQPRADLALEIIVVAPVRRAGEADGHARGARGVDGDVRPLLLGEAAEERAVAAVAGAEAVARGIEAVMDHARRRQLGHERALPAADGHEVRGTARVQRLQARVVLAVV